MIIGDGLIIIPKYFTNFVKEKILLDTMPNQFFVLQGVRKDTLSTSLIDLESFVTKHGSEFEIINRSTLIETDKGLKEVAIVKVVGLVSWKMEDLVEDEKKERENSENTNKELKEVALVKLLDLLVLKMKNLAEIEKKEIENNENN